MAIFSESKDILRIWKDDQVHSIPEDYYDDSIVAYAKKIGAEKDFYTATKLIGSVLYHSANDLSESHTSCDAFFDYRIRILIKRGVFEAQDIFKPDLKYKIKLIS
ncbi:PF12395 family protein [Leptospira interrogans serovar Grippotyphosa str. LT2186]|uniref:PF12395 family protein n=1 Tax=Leptospira interrogans serovar Grippotyphosa str. LT2186 TaxID=1001599 RepID=M3H1G8_LEPIR|nr:PF12395 family protein [Leptospira interrogans serovar Grippotyphosa str. LT2186]